MGGKNLVISSVAPEPVRSLLAHPWDSDTGTLAVQIVKTQLANHEMRRNRRARKDMEGRLPSLVDVATEQLARYIGEDAENVIKSMKGLPPNVLSRVALRLESMPYDIFCKVRQSAGEHEVDADEWVLQNEVWLREASTASEQQTGASTKHFRVDGEAMMRRLRTSDWARGLVRLSMHANVVFPGSTLTETCRIITRPTSLPGFKILDGRRPPAIRIQPSVERYRKTFEAMTGGLLKGLNWDNLLVAGGIVLGALLCTDDKEATNTPAQWKSSDIDLYIHGLGPVEANKKIEHIFSVFKANLGEDVPVLVVRNSKTITFYPKYPLRRLQVVLKLSSSPKDVILNFDLDVCAVGWDGEEVWMLPRAARALERYTVFTMDLINGHYLGDRRATQEQRIFKYADKGFGIRILPHYLAERQIIMDDPEKCKKFKIDAIRQWDLRDFDEIVEAARKWTDTVVKGISTVDGKPIPNISHSMLQENEQNSEDPPRRSVLSGFGLFMRHVALWEHEVAGSVIIQKKIWAASMYDNIYFFRFGVSYNDTPDYAWDKNFTTEGFIEKMTDFNESERMLLNENLDELFHMSKSRLGDKFEASSWPDPKTFLTRGCIIQRITHADSVAQILQPDCDIYLPMWLPKNFIEFANDLIPERVQKSSVVPDYLTKTFTQALADNAPAALMEVDGLTPLIWRITNITMWQQWDRTIDEVHEVLWTFHLVNAAFQMGKEDRLALLVGQFARNAIRMTEQDEYGAFARWVARKPAKGCSNYNPYYQFLSQEEEFGQGDG